VANEAATGRLRRWAGRVLLAAASPMMPRLPELAQDDRELVEGEMQVFLVRQIFSMPRYLLGPYLLALVGFDLLPLATRRHRFSDLTRAQRSQLVARWSGSPIAQQRDLIKLIRNCALYYYLDHPVVRNALDELGSAEHVV
jgi:hypothetical protein